MNRPARGDLFLLEGTEVYDVWFDQEDVEKQVITAVTESVTVQIVNTMTSGELTITLPALYSFGTDQQGNLTFVKETTPIGGMTAYPMPADREGWL